MMACPKAILPKTVAPAGVSLDRQQFYGTLGHPFQQPLGVSFHNSAFSPINSLEVNRMVAYPPNPPMYNVPFVNQLSTSPYATSNVNCDKFDVVPVPGGTLVIPRHHQTFMENSFPAVSMPSAQVVYSSVVPALPQSPYALLNGSLAPQISSMMPVGVQTACNQSFSFMSGSASATHPTGLAPPGFLNNGLMTPSVGNSGLVHSGMSGAGPSVYNSQVLQHSELSPFVSSNLIPHQNAATIISEQHLAPPTEISKFYSNFNHNLYTTEKPVNAALHLVPDIPAQQPQQQDTLALNHGQNSVPLPYAIPSLPVQGERFLPVPANIEQRTPSSASLPQSIYSTNHPNTYAVPQLPVEKNLVAENMLQDRTLHSYPGLPAPRPIHPSVAGTTSFLNGHVEEKVESRYCPPVFMSPRSSENVVNGECAVKVEPRIGQSAFVSPCTVDQRLNGDVVVKKEISRYCPPVMVSPADQRPKEEEDRKPQFCTQFLVSQDLPEVKVNKVSEQKIESKFFQPIFPPSAPPVSSTHTIEVRTKVEVFERSSSESSSQPEHKLQPPIVDESTQPYNEEMTRPSSAASSLSSSDTILLPEVDAAMLEGSLSSNASESHMPSPPHLSSDETTEFQLEVSQASSSSSSLTFSSFRESKTKKKKSKLKVVKDVYAFEQDSEEEETPSRFKFKFQKKHEERLTKYTGGSARTQPFKRRGFYDMFDFLASPHRKPPTYEPPSDDEDEDATPRQSRKSLSNILSKEVAMVISFHCLKTTAKETVGVFQSLIHGRGLYSKRDIDAGEMVIEYAGEVIRSLLTDKRERYYESRGIGCYMFRIDEDEVVDATMHGNAARFINHSCDPNCYSKVISVYGKNHIVIFALRKIYKGEELTYDYKFPIEEVKIPCTCGARRCRKFLN